MRSWLLGWRLRYKRLAQIGVDIVLIWLALWLAFFVRLGLADVVNPFTDRTWLFIVAPLITIPIFVFSGMRRIALCRLRSFSHHRQGCVSFCFVIGAINLLV